MAWWMRDPIERIPWWSFLVGAILLIVACRLPSAWRYIRHGEPP